NEAAKAVAAIPEEMESYAQIRRLAHSGQFARAIQSLGESPISQSTKQHLQKVLETNNQYVIDRTFLELDSSLRMLLMNASASGLSSCSRPTTQKWSAKSFSTPEPSPLRKAPSSRGNKYYTIKNFF
ncbi:unnamed protein product, partial [marine sediment metagenome]